MIGRLVFEYSDDCQRVEYLFEDGLIDDYDYLIWIKLPQGRKIDLPKLKQGLNKYFLRKLNGKQYQKDFPDRVELLKMAYDNDLDLLENCDVIRLCGTSDIPIDDQAFLDNKKIYLTDTTYPLDIKTVEELEKKYKGYKNVYVNVAENEDPVSLENYRKTVEVLNKVVAKIKSYDLSPLEQVIYAYDYARDKIRVKNHQVLHEI